ncbi:MAG: methyl-coenzyme M reductase operon protein D [Methanosarcinaceae archaeon]|nr:methyl-coenzyme M reductase operon protein D [Methanosarcinaceae archaeon]MDD4748713.1 methyl-coenzyme M reductase operon protein D [Methanosarcinaceae archaeon]
MSDSAENTKNPLQIEIFPSRILSPQTAQKLLAEIYQIDGILRVMVQGHRLPTKVGFGPGTGEKVEHPQRKAIEVEGQVIELKVNVGRLRLEVADAEVKEKVRKACEKVFPFPFEFREGHFLKRKATVTDYAKLGPNADPKLLGMVDPKAGNYKNLIFIDNKKGKNPNEEE